MTGPLDGLRVLEFGHAVAGPFAAGLLGDFGAEIIKIERPGVGDNLRFMGPKVDGYSIWWSVTGRNKKSITLDLKSEQGLDIAKSLIQIVDVVVTNFAPGAMDRVGLSWPTMSGINPRLVRLNISGYGLTGPLKDRKGFGKIAEAFSGATNLTGHRGEPAVHPSWPTGDLICGLAGAFGVMVALNERERSGKGQLVDLALYEFLFRMLEWQMPIFELLGEEVERNGPRFPFAQAFLTDICPSKDGHGVVVSAATSSMLGRIEELVAGDPSLAGDKETLLADKLRAWVGARTADEAFEKLEEAGVVAGLVNTPRTLAEHPQIIARENVTYVPDSVIGTIPMPSPSPKLLRTPGSVKWAGPSLGEHTDEVLHLLLGMTEGEIAEYRVQGVI